MTPEPKINPFRDRIRSESPKPFALDSDTKVSIRLGLLVSILGAVMTFAWVTISIYQKMPSADQVQSLDAKHTARADQLAKEIADNRGTISNLSGQVGFLVRIEVEKARASDDPDMRRAVSRAAREARAAAAQPQTSKPSDPTAGLEQLE